MRVRRLSNDEIIKYDGPSTFSSLLVFLLTAALAAAPRGTGAAGRLPPAGAVARPAPRSAHTLSTAIGIRTA